MAKKLMSMVNLLSLMDFSVCSKSFSVRYEWSILSLIYEDTIMMLSRTVSLNSFL